MATIDLGRIKFKWQGAWSSSTAYVVDDVVESGGNTYVCILASTNNEPPNATYWELMAQKGTDTSVATTQGDIIYHNGTSLARLPAGTSGEALITGGSGANPSWGTSGGVIQVKTARQSATESWTADNVMVGPTATITPSSSSNKILVMVQATFGHGTDTVTGSVGLRYATGTSVTTSGTLVGGGDAAGSRSQSIAWAGSSYQSWNGINVGYHILHNPATTSQISYKICFQSHDGGTAYLGRTGRDTNNSDHPRVDTNITLMEIASGVL